MPNNPSLANKHHWEALAARMAESSMSPEEQIEWNEIHWPTLTAEPIGVSYVDAAIDGILAMWAIPKGARDDRVIFYSHGGGFIAGSIYSHRKLVGHIAKAAGCRALIYDYPYAHQQKYPAQHDIAFRAYRWLLDEGIKLEHLAVAGDSIGASLTFGVLQQARREGLPMPAAVMILSGWLDMALSGASYETNRDKDTFFNRQGSEWLVSTFLGEGDRKDPLLSALYADLQGLPPIYLQAGADEVLVDESRMFAERAGRAGVEVKLDVFPEMLHTFQMMAGRAPEADDAIGRLADWVGPRLGLTKTAARPGARLEVA